MGPEDSLPHTQELAICPILNLINPVYVSPFHLPKINLILPSHLRLGLPSFLFPSYFTAGTLCTSLLSLIRATCPAIFILLGLVTRIVFDEQYRSWSISLCSLLHSPFYTVRLKPKYRPQHPILRHPQHTLIPQYKRPSFRPIQKNGKNCTSVYLNHYILGQQTGRQMILHRIKESISDFILYRSL